MIMPAATERRSSGQATGPGPAGCQCQMMSSPPSASGEGVDVGRSGDLPAPGRIGGLDDPVAQTRQELERARAGQAYRATGSEG